MESPCKTLPSATAPQYPSLVPQQSVQFLLGGNAAQHLEDFDSLSIPLFVLPQNLDVLSMPRHPLLTILDQGLPDIVIAPSRPAVQERPQLLRPGHPLAVQLFRQEVTDLLCQVFPVLLPFVNLVQSRAGLVHPAQVVFVPLPVGDARFFLPDRPINLLIGLIELLIVPRDLPVEIVCGGIEFPPDQAGLVAVRAPQTPVGHGDLLHEHLLQGALRLELIPEPLGQGGKFRRVLGPFAYGDNDLSGQ